VHHLSHQLTGRMILVSED